MLYDYSGNNELLGRWDNVVNTYRTLFSSFIELVFGNYK